MKCVFFLTNHDVNHKYIVKQRTFGFVDSLQFVSACLGFVNNLNVAICIMCLI